MSDHNTPLSVDDDAQARAVAGEDDDARIPAGPPVEPPADTSTGDDGPAPDSSVAGVEE
ncbi:MAG: hypothetical protein H0V19_01860, partial [Euzebyales bacterium]|nr:hypothetical protein [Euzebyales bacterium]